MITAQVVKTSLSTTVLFRTVFTRTIILNLRIKILKSFFFFTRKFTEGQISGEQSVQQAVWLLQEVIQKRPVI